MMLAATMASIALEFRLKSPELLGYCSSLLRDSRFFDAQFGTGSAVGGAERSRMFKALRVRLLDVGTPTGKARLAIAQDGTGEAELLKRAKMYS